MAAESLSDVDPKALSALSFDLPEDRKPNLHSCRIILDHRHEITRATVAVGQFDPVETLKWPNRELMTQKCQGYSQKWHKYLCSIRVNVGYAPD